MAESSREAEAARRDLLRETVTTRNTLVTAIAVATLLILAVVAYVWWNDPYTKCKRLEPKITARDANPSSAELDAWTSQECEEWPGI